MTDKVLQMALFRPTVQVDQEMAAHLDRLRAAGMKPENIEQTATHWLADPDGYREDVHNAERTIARLQQRHAELQAAREAKPEPAPPQLDAASRKLVEKAAKVMVADDIRNAERRMHNALGNWNYFHLAMWAAGDEARLTQIAKARSYMKGWVEHAMRNWLAVYGQASDATAVYAAAAPVVDAAAIRRQKAERQAERRRQQREDEDGPDDGAPSYTPPPSVSSQVFRYVRHADVARFTAEGWELLPALDGTHHGAYAALMRRRP